MAKFFHCVCKNRKQYDNNNGGDVKILFYQATRPFSEEIEENAFGAKPHSAKNDADENKFHYGNVGHPAKPAKKHIRHGRQSSDCNGPKIIFLVDFERFVSESPEIKIEQAEGQLSKERTYPFAEANDPLAADCKPEGECYCAAEHGYQ